jgi:tetratricopeptide (TPR) repeat protein
MKVFISYRRADSAAYSGRLRDWLERRFGDGSVFLDVSDIDGGDAFTPVISNALAMSDAMVVVIGQSWASIADGAHRRLDNPADLVRAEIRTALDRGLAIVPVLVGGASMPDGDQLPDELRALVTRDACELSDRRWADDVAHLGDALERRVGAPPPAAVAISLGHYDTAIEILTRQLADGPTAEAFYERGLARYNLGQLREAIADWDAALRLKAAFPMALRQRGNAFYALGDDERALRDYEAAIALEPNEPRAYVNRAALHEQRGEYARAIADLQTVLTLRRDATLERAAEAKLLDLRARHGEGAGG